jgi:mannose-6-phosphate isomerase-like protein (cupin superfamily)
MKQTQEEAVMSAQQTQQTVFKYSTPEAGKAKTIVRLCRSDIMYASVHVLTHGGETNLHAHLAQDGFWMVLKGRARFYGEGNVLIADLGPNEGILVPRGCQYWFESGSSELLELLQVEAIDKTVENRRIDYTPVTSATKVAREALRERNQT